ncbi:MAG: hypothetical protein ABF532_09665 [Bifidobacterium sp.]|jgi:phage-related protein|uniref:hypothetical protein n=1 Tax=Bifidobacterium sp. TaxID=41200 RepID=UPI0039ED2193
MTAIVGSGAVSIFPVMTGIKKKISAEFGSAGAAGAKSFDQSTRGAGLKAGKTIGGELKQGIKSAASGMETPGLSSLRNDVAKTAQAVSAARLKQLGTAAQLKTAEDSLANAVAKHGSDSKQAEAAALRLEAAQLRDKQASEALTISTGKLKTAQASLATVQTQAAAASQGLGSRMLDAARNFRTGFKDLDAGKASATGLSGAFGSLAGSLAGPVAGGLGKLRAGWANADMAMLDGAGTLGRIGGAARGMVDAVASKTAKLGSSIAAPFKAAGGLARQFGSDLSYGIGQRLAPAKAAIGGFASSIAAPFKSVGATVGGYLSNVGGAAGSVFGKLAPIASSAAGGLKNAFSLAGDSIKAKLSGVGDSVKGLATLSVGGLAAGVGALGTALIGVGKSAFTAYSTYEQAVGGIDTLFKGASKTVQNYAAQAYKTSGVSANDYMQQITSFSATLISSLGGDTAQAAKIGDMAMVDMSDNANKLGTGIGDIQNAYQGFAKQNYTMLDNLKLGYGGTKEEMQRLLTDATKLTGVHYDISKFSDVVQAIHAVQQNLGIAGTTSREAATTIEGSVGSMKAAWQNWLSELGKSDADMPALTSQLATSIGTALKNIIPRVAVIAKSIVAAIPSMFGQLSTLLPAPIQQAISKIAGLADQFKGALAPIAAAFGALGAGGLAPLLSKIPMLGGLLGGLQGPLAALGGPLGILLAAFGGLIAASPQLQAVFGATLNPLLDQLGSILAGLQPVFEQMTAAIGGMVQQVMPVINGFVAALIPVIGQIIATLMPIVPAVLQPIMNAVTQMAPVVATIIAQIVGFIQATLLPAIQAMLPYVSNVINAIGAIVNGIVAIVKGVINMVAGILSGNWPQVWEGFKQVVSGAIGALGGIVSGIKDIIVGALKGAGTWLLDAGKAIIQGLVDGIKSMAKAAGDAIGGIMGKISEWIPHSPAKRGPFSGRGWTTYSGAAIVDGLAQGITGNASAAADAINGAMNRASNAAGSVQAAYRSAVPANGVAPPVGGTPASPAGQGGGNSVNVSIDAHGMNAGDIFNEFDLRTRQAASSWGEE